MNHIHISLTEMARPMSKEALVRMAAGLLDQGHDLPHGVGPQATKAVALLKHKLAGVGKPRTRADINWTTKEWYYTPIPGAPNVTRDEAIKGSSGTDFRIETWREVVGALQSAAGMDPISAVEEKPFRAYMRDAAGVLWGLAPEDAIAMLGHTARAGVVPNPEEWNARRRGSPLPRYKTPPHMHVIMAAKSTDPSGVQRWAEQALQDIRSAMARQQVKVQASHAKAAKAAVLASETINGTTIRATHEGAMVVFSGSPTGGHQVMDLPVGRWRIHWDGYVEAARAALER